MRTLKTNSIAILAMAAAAMAANTATAGGFSFSSGGSGNNKGSFKVSFGNTNQNNSKPNVQLACHKNNYHPHYHVKKYYVKPVLVYDHCYHPQFRACFVYPGDTWYSICQRVYGCTHLWKHIAIYNGLPFNAPLVPGQQLMLPVVNANGTLAASNAPMPMPFVSQAAPIGPIGPQTTQFAPQSFGPQTSQFAPQGSSVAPQGLPTSFNTSSTIPQGQPISTLPSGLNQLPSQNSNLTITTAPIANAPVASAPIISEPTLPKVAIGSELTFPGQSLGEVKGTARLRIGEMALPVEVLEWSATSLKIRMPNIDISRPIKADLEVLRADGSVAAKSTIELTPAVTSLALGN